MAILQNERPSPSEGQGPILPLIAFQQDENGHPELYVEQLQKDGLKQKTLPLTDNEFAILTVIARHTPIDPNPLWQWHTDAGGYITSKQIAETPGIELNTTWVTRTLNKLDRKFLEYSFHKTFQNLLLRIPVPQQNDKIGFKFRGNIHFD